MSAPRLVTRQTLAATAPARWAAVYHTSARTTKIAITSALMALGPDPAPDDVDRIIGNRTWTDTGACNGCGAEDGSPRVEVGELPDYESATARLCYACACEAVAAFGRAP